MTDASQERWKGSKPGLQAAAMCCLNHWTPGAAEPFGSTPLAAYLHMEGHSRRILDILDIAALFLQHLWPVSLTRTSTDQIPGTTKIQICSRKSDRARHGLTNRLQPTIVSIPAGSALEPSAPLPWGSSETAS